MRKGKKIGINQNPSLTNIPTFSKSRRAGAKPEPATLKGFGFLGKNGFGLRVGGWASHFFRWSFFSSRRFVRKNAGGLISFR